MKMRNYTPPFYIENSLVLIKREKRSNKFIIREKRAKLMFSFYVIIVLAENTVMIKILIRENSAASLFNTFKERKKR